MVKSTFSRMADILRSNVNEALDRIEDPEKMVRQMIRDMEGTVNDAVGSVGTAVANQRRLEKERDQYRDKAAEFAERAQQAVATDSDDLARKALERKVHYERAAEDLEPALVESETTAEQMKDRLHELREGLKEARRREGSLIARCQAIRAQGGAPAPDETTGSDPFVDFQQLEQRISRHESEFERLKDKLQSDDAAAEADDEVRRDLDGDEPRLNRRIQEAEAQERVERELQRLRQGSGNQQ